MKIHPTNWQDQNEMEIVEWHFKYRKNQIQWWSQQDMEIAMFKIDFSNDKFQYLVINTPMSHTISLKSVHLFNTHCETGLFVHVIQSSVGPTLWSAED